MEEKKKKYLSCLLYTLTFILGLIVGMSVLFFLEYSGTTTIMKDYNARQSADTETEETQEEEQATPSVLTNTYTGSHISGELPQDWSIVEYTDNTGSDTLMSGYTYSGLVGLKVFNENDTEMFYLKAVDGIGGAEGCNIVYAFSDSDQAYLDHGNDWTLEVGTVPSTVVDLTNSTYTEYEVLGWEVRRVANTLYRNMSPNLPGFNPACGVSEILTVSNLAYYKQTPVGITSGNTYLMEISSTVDLNQLEELDAVLESLTVN